ncbi:MAG: ASKHA domain-containing protein, partial [Hasllibacter sp.]
MTDPLVVFTPSGKRGRVASGTSVLDAARQLGVDLDSVCGGNGICSKCQVVPVPGPHPKHGIEMREGALTGLNKVEERYDRVRGLKPGRRLGCQARVQADAVLDVPPESQVHRQVIRKDASDVAIALDPTTRLHLVTVREPDMDEPSGDLERLKDALADQWGIEGITAPLPALAALQPALRKGGWQVTCAIHTPRDGRPVLTGVFPGLREAPLLGLAVDLGSTTIAAHLCDLSTGAVLASGGVMNPQIRFGEDLMSRVSYSMMNPGGAVEMTAAVREALDTLAVQVCADADADPSDVFEAAIVCNPVMHHLLLGLDPVELGQAPFALAVQGALELEAREIGLTAAAPAARAYLLPCIAGHVGADAAAVALAENPGARPETSLVVDVGTNAEILLGNEAMTLACSSPTGPAFEGAQISAGQRAAPGAIERVEIDPDIKTPRFRVIGTDAWSDDPAFDAPVTGICGSGIIEAIAEMRMAGIVDASGLIGGPDATGSDRCVPDGRTFAYVLHGDIRVTQGDVRAIQLAKSALYAGARLLMDEMGTDTVDRVVLAGAFGAHISPKHAMVLGMIPDAPIEAVHGAGNAAGTGARMALLNRGMRARVETLVSEIRKIETATEPRFQEHFVAANALPHAT